MTAIMAAMTVSKSVRGHGGRWGGCAHDWRDERQGNRELSPWASEVGRESVDLYCAETLLIAVFSMVSLAHLVGRSILTFLRT